jgi:hypothetical protein
LHKNIQVVVPPTNVPSHELNAIVHTFKTHIILVDPNVPVSVHGLKYGDRKPIPSFFYIYYNVNGIIIPIAEVYRDIHKEGCVHKVLPADGQRLQDLRHGVRPAFNNTHFSLYNMYFGLLVSGHKDFPDSHSGIL